MAYSTGFSSTALLHSFRLFFVVSFLRHFGCSHAAHLTSALTCRKSSFTALLGEPEQDELVRSSDSGLPSQITLVSCLLETESTDRYS